MSDMHDRGCLMTRGPFVLDGKCAENVGHQHNYDHVTFVHRGKVAVFRGDAPDACTEHWGDFEAGDFIEIARGKCHRIKALTADAAYYCVYPHRDAAGLVAEEYQGCERSYV